MTLENDLGAALAQLNQGKFKPALKAAKTAMKRHKTHPAFPNVAGICLSGLGKHRDAVPYFKKALSLDAGFHDARKNLAQTLIFLDRAETALGLLERVLANQPRDTGALYLKAQAQAALGQSDAAIETVSASLATDSRQPRALRLRGLLHKSLSDFADAVDDYGAALALNPNDADALVNISLPLARLGRQDEATEAARKAVALAPGDIEAHRRLAAQLISNGDNDAARNACAQLLKTWPGDPVAIEFLAQMNTREQNAELEAVAKRALKTIARSAPDRAYLDFALARIAGQTGDAAAFADHLRSANAGMAARKPYEMDETARTFDTLIARFPDRASVVSTLGSTGPKPIYVIGMPRSGTTLTETLLAANPAVMPLGERAVPDRLLAQYLENDTPFDADQASAFVTEDIARLPEFSEQATTYVDKMPENYRLLGFLAKAYPDCRIVQMRRDPRDVALSIWQAHFSGVSMTYAYDLAAMADRFNFHARLMAHWHAIMPGRILELRYEDLVADIDGQSRRLAEFCGLDWVEDMAHPERHTGQILTFSATQVRQTVHARSVGKWRQHEEMLKPFISGLDPELWPEIAD